MDHGVDVTSVKLDMPMHYDEDHQNKVKRQHIYSYKRHMLMNAAVESKLQDEEIHYPNVVKLKENCQFKMRWDASKNYYAEDVPDEVIQYIKTTMGFRKKKTKYMPWFVELSKDNMVLEVSTTTCSVNLRSVINDRVKMERYGSLIIKHLI